MHIQSVIFRSNVSLTYERCSDYTFVSDPEVHGIFPLLDSSVTKGDTKVYDYYTIFVNFQH